MELHLLEHIRGQIEAARRFDQLRALRDRIHGELGERLHRADPLEWNAAANRVHDWLIRRTIRLSELMLEDKGMGAPPAPYAFVLFGSGGRGEQTLWSDQDNGIVYTGGRSTQEADDGYFRELAGCIFEGLEALGYPPCPGNVLGTNERWRQPLSGWKRMIDRWLAEPHWESVRYLLIQADARCVYGAEEIVAELRAFYFRRVAEQPSVLAAMLNNTLHHKVARGMFGQLIRERYGPHAGGVDIKYGAYIPFINGVRLLAIEGGVQATASAERIAELARLGKVEQERAEEWRKALALVLKLRSLTPCRMEGGAYASDGKLPPGLLTRTLKEELKYCLRVGHEVQTYVKKAVENAMKAAT